jgi:hypothetical protein
MADTHTDADAKRLADEREQRRADAQRKLDESRVAAHQAEEKRRAEEFQANEARLAEVRKRMEARRKEDQRRAALSPPERAAEDEKRAAMTPEERLADDESKGLSPEQFDQINLLAGTPQFSVKTEVVPHAAGFILSEANGNLSRDYGQFLDPATVYVGQPIAQSAPASGNTPATYIVVATTAGANAIGLAIYGGQTSPGNPILIAALTRNAEVNKNLVYWGTLTAGDQTAVISALASRGIIFR